VSRLPVLALVGRPNVGKSTLFNRLTRTRNAIVADVPGLTRDRQYGRGRSGDYRFIVIDSGGFEPVAKDGIAAEMARQTRQAIVEADFVVFVVDGREGLTRRDQEIANELRRAAAKPILAVNKTEGMPRAQVISEFFELGLDEPIAISAAHGEGVRELVEHLIGNWPGQGGEHSSESNAGLESPQAIAFSTEAPHRDHDEAGASSLADEEGKTDAAQGPEGEALETAFVAAPKATRVAIVGRPNVGKSTLINTLLGEERVLAFDEPGTTRDAIEIDFQHQGRPYILVDTAGIRRRGKVTEAIEKFSVIKTLQAIEDSNVCILMLDASQEVSDQDANISGYILEAGRALVISINKWDKLDEYEKTRIKKEFERKLHFLGFARTHFTSALKGFGVGALMRSVDEACAAAYKKLTTPKLTRALIDAVEKQAPPRHGPFRPKLRYAHQGGSNPPIVVIHGNSLDYIAEPYKRYLESMFREKFSLTGTPLRIEFRSTVNPYAREAGRPLK
jgi:GTPase